MVFDLGYQLDMPPWQFLDLEDSINSHVCSFVLISGFANNLGGLRFSSHLIVLCRKLRVRWHFYKIWESKQFLSAIIVLSEAELNCWWSYWASMVILNGVHVILYRLSEAVAYELTSSVKNSLDFWGKWTEHFRPEASSVQDFI